jgi:hypothetical protein
LNCCTKIFRLFPLAKEKPKARQRFELIHSKTPMGAHCILGFEISRFAELERSTT